MSVVTQMGLEGFLSASKGRVGITRHDLPKVGQSSRSRRLSVIAVGALAAGVALLSGCENSAADDSDQDSAHATIGPEGGEIIGAKGSKLEGVHVVVPPGALTTKTDLTVKLVSDGTALPPTAVRCGPTVALEPAGLVLAQAATVTVPFDESVVEQNLRLDDEVKLWVRDGDHWGQQHQSDVAPGAVTFELSTLTNVAAGVTPAKDVDIVRFKLSPNPKFEKCFAQYPDDPSRRPQADVVVVRGDLADSLKLRAKNIKPGMKFDMFTIEKSQLKSDATADPNFTNFGLAWYQSDVEAEKNGSARVTLRTILLDQIFGFDPVANLSPTGTFHVGFWFNDPNDAAPCGFDPAHPTPFNGDHDAGPVAMISVPDGASNLGPLCTKPDTSTSPARCSP